MRKIISVLTALTGMLAPQLSWAADTSAVCKTLERHNVDCSCVAARMVVFQNTGNSTAVKNVLAQRYAYALGQNNDLEQAERTFRSNPMDAVQSEMAFDNVGGMPGNITDFEEGCILTSAPSHKFSDLTPGSAVSRLTEARVKSVGENYRDTAVCVGHRMSEYLSDNEMEAYFLSYTHCEGDHTNDDKASQAKKMGVSKSKFIKLEKKARKKIDARGDRDENYCGAMTYPATITLAQNQKARDEFSDHTGQAKTSPEASEVIIEEGETKPQEIKGDARTRMIQLCMMDSPNEAICSCTTDKLRARLSPNDFAFVVAVREADFDGADDPLAAAAASRGMTSAQAQQSVGMNASMMGGMLGMDVMSCMGGGMPNMPTMPNMNVMPDWTKMQKQ